MPVPRNGTNFQLMLSRPPSSALFIRTPVTVTMPNTNQISVVVQMFFKLATVSWNLCVESSRKKKLTVVSMSTCLLSQKSTERNI